MEEEKEPQFCIDYKEACSVYAEELRIHAVNQLRYANALVVYQEAFKNYLKERNNHVSGK